MGGGEGRGRVHPRSAGSRLSRPHPLSPLLQAARQRRPTIAPHPPRGLTCGGAAAWRPPGRSAQRRQRGGRGNPERRGRRVGANTLPPPSPLSNLPRRCAVVSQGRGPARGAPRRRACRSSSAAARTALADLRPGRVRGLCSTLCIAPGPPPLEQGPLCKHFGAQVRLGVPSFPQFSDSSCDGVMSSEY